MCVCLCVGIIYCLSRNNAEEVCRELCAVGISAGCYHTDRLPGDKTRVHTQWLNNSLQVSSVLRIKYADIILIIIKVLIVVVYTYKNVLYYNT